MSPEPLFGPLTVFILFAGIGGLAGIVLAGLGSRLGTGAHTLTERVLACLPQTQCAQCGFPGCRPYAAAVAAGTTTINRCPPGGEATIAKLAELLGEPLLGLDEGACSVAPGRVAVVDEDACIGCAVCLDACPVDAIVGASRHMHTVIAAECTGCGLCVDPCPVDCIRMDPAPP